MIRRLLRRLRPATITVYIPAPQHGGPVEWLPAQDVYVRGFEDGTELALLLLIGRETAGAAPYRGPLPDEARQWAQDALARLGEHRSTPEPVDARLRPVDEPREDESDGYR